MRKLERFFSALLVVAISLTGVSWPSRAYAGPGAITQGIVQAFGGNVDQGTVGTPTNGQVLTYSTTTNSWRAASAAGGGVTSITGTALQIARDSATGAVTLSLPAAITLPGTLTAGGTITLGAQTLALASATVSGTPTWSSSQAITLSTAAQTNVTSLGTLTGLTVNNTIQGVDGTAGTALTVRGGNGSAGVGALLTTAGGNGVGANFSSGGHAVSTGNSSGTGGGSLTFLVAPIQGSGSGTNTAATVMQLVPTTNAATGAQFEATNSDNTNASFFTDVPFASYASGGTSLFQFATNTGNPIRGNLATATAGTGFTVSMQRGRGTLAATTTVSTGDTLAKWTFAGATSSAAFGSATLTNAAQVQVDCEGTISSGNCPGRMIFGTTTTTTNVQRLCLDSAAGFKFNSAMLMGWVASATDPTGTLDTSFVRLGAGQTGIFGATSATGGSFRIDGTGSANGQALKIDSASELLTLSTVGLTTDTAANLLPANAIILAVDTRVTATITTTTNWAVGDATTAARFSAANATLTAGTAQVGITQMGATGAASSIQTAAAKVRITCTGANPGAGIVRITVHYILLTAPTS